MDSSIIFRQACTTTLFEIASFRERLRELQSGDYPTRAATQFIAKLITDSHNLEVLVRQAISEREIDPIGALDDVRNIHRFLCSRLPLLTHLSNAQTRRVPWSIVESIERLFRTVIDTGEIIIACSDQYNYSIMWKLAHGFTVLQLPSLHRLNPFMHVLVGHELFHPLTDPFIDKHQADALTRLKSQCSDHIANTPSFGDLFDKVRLDKMVEHARSLWRSGIEEVICDLGCAAIFGPAALLATSSFSSVTQPDTPPDASRRNLHPPWRFRLRTVLNHALSSSDAHAALSGLRELLKSDPSTARFSDVMDKCINEIESSTKNDSDATGINKDPVTRIAYTVLKDHIDDAWTFVTGIVSKLDERWNNCIREIPSCLSLLQRCIPPSEIPNIEGQAPDSSSASAITMACWLYLMGQNHQTFNEDFMREYHRACRLMFKALEDSELKRWFNKNVSELQE